MITELEQGLTKLQDAGYWVTYAPDWKAVRAPGVFNPVGILVHHTGIRRPLGIEEAQLRNRFGVPLCNVIVRTSGEIVAVCNGRAADSGMGSSVHRKEIASDQFVAATAKARGLRDDESGNPWFWDIEVDSPGDGSPITTAQRNALVGLGWMISDAAGWRSPRVSGHKYHTSRKIDPNWPNLSVPVLRGIIEELRNPAPPKPPARDHRLLEIERKAAEILALAKSMD